MKKIIIYDIVTESLVRETFSILSEDLGFTILSSRNYFPDFILSDGSKIIRVEAEVTSSNFNKHGHSIDDCDMLICYRDDLAKKLPLDVLELEDFIEIIENSDISNTIRELRSDNFIQMKDKILKFLENGYPRDYSIQDIADAIKVHRSTATKYLKILHRIGMIVHTRKHGTTKNFTINKNTNVKGMSSTKKKE